MPAEAVTAVLRQADAAPESVLAYVVAEEGLSVTAGLPSLQLDHHHGHAATAFLTSPFETAAILVCDQNSDAQVSVWRGHGNEVVRQHWPWSGSGFASLFTQCAQIFGFGHGQEHRLEALARLDAGAESHRFRDAFRYGNGSLHVDPQWTNTITDWLHKDGPQWPVEHATRVAAAFQCALGDALVMLIADIRTLTGATHLCLGGGLFYNTYFNTRVAMSGMFDQVFVPPNPGNAGIAAGAALSLGARASGPREAVSPFLGPEYSTEEIKATLDNCKLSYECCSYDELIDSCVRDLLAGRLVGWFHGRMEWGHRALGNRSILANPLSPYVLDNLNVFLKQRERRRAYGLSVCEEQLGQHFEGPLRSAWMEYEYRVKDTGLFRHVLPAGAAPLRVQTVDQAPSLFRQLHLAFAAASGTGVLVNTSFNGFSEPIVCSPRDAIRVFYGTGLDVLVLGRFVLRK